MSGPEEKDNKSPYVTTGTLVSAISHGDGIPMAADSRRLEDNKSKTLSHYVTYTSPYVTDTSASAIPHGDVLIIAGYLRSLEDIKSRTLIPYVTGMSVPAMGHRGVIPMAVLECKLVCRRWGTLIRESNFANMHLRRLINYHHGGDDNGNDNIDAKVEPSLIFACHIEHHNDYGVLLFHGGELSDRIDEKYIYNQNLKRIYHPPMHKETGFNHLVGSCNGLVCAFKLHNTILDPIYICNPLTREYVYLPELVVKKEAVANPGRIEEGEVSMYYFTSCGFGYVRSTNEYKVVRIHYIDYKGGIVEVYTLGSGCGWRAIGRVPYQLDTFGGGRGAYANDAMYWTAHDKVVAFDLATEEFRSLSVPPRMENRQRKDKWGLVALGRNLCLYMDDKLHVQIWSLMESSGLKETWSMKFDINYEGILGASTRSLRPILLAKSGEIILIYCESVLYSYNKETTFLNMISDGASTDCIEDVDGISHVNTLVSLEAMGENSKRYTVRQRRVRTPWDDVIDELDRDALGEEIDTTHFRLR